MLIVETIARIRREHFIKGKTIRRLKGPIVPRLTALSRKLTIPPGKSRIGVMNLAYGTVDDLPFDIHRTRSWPVTYRLAEGAANDEVATVKKALADDLFLRLRPFLSKTIEKAEEKFALWQLLVTERAVAEGVWKRQ
jgi:hypothetical protein